MDLDRIGIRLWNASEKIKEQIKIRREENECWIEYGSENEIERDEEYSRIVAKENDFAYFTIDRTSDCSGIYVNVFLWMVTNDAIAAAAINEILYEVNRAFDIKYPIFIIIKGFVYDKYCKNIGFGFQKSCLQFEEDDGWNDCDRNLLVISRNPTNTGQFTSIALPFQMRLRDMFGIHFQPTDFVEANLYVHIINDSTYVLMPENPILFAYDKKLTDCAIEISDEMSIKWVKNARLNKSGYWDTSNSSWEGVTKMDSYDQGHLLFQGILINKNEKRIQRYVEEYRQYQRLCRYLVLRTKFIVKIQRAWRRCISDPAYRVCQKRILREFEEDFNLSSS
jgi:hypothetical protein